jgi:ABC-type uncharacterized transport system permease subunit
VQADTAILKPFSPLTQNFEKPLLKAIEVFIDFGIFLIFLFFHVA